MAGSDGIVVVRNPRSGTAIDRDTLRQALHREIADAEILDVPEGGAPERWLESVVSRHDLIIVAGGDGTVSTTAHAAARTGKLVAIIPAGTRNHFARDLGIPADLEGAAAVLSSGREHTADVGVVNNHPFLNNVSLGNYPRMVRVREELEQRGRSRTIATTIAVARTWWQLRKLTVAITIDGRHLTRRSPFLMIGNGSYVLSGFALGRRERISDGQLCLYVAPPTGRFGVLTLPFRALAGTLERHEQFETFCASTITAALAAPRVSAAIDGEVRELDTPLQFSVRRHALRVLVP